MYVRSYINLAWNNMIQIGLQLWDTSGTEISYYNYKKTHNLDLNVSNIYV